jgi:regulator of replication initiation timing
MSAYKKRDDLESDLVQCKRELQKTNQMLAVLKQEISTLRKENYHKQNVATRLIVQRNTFRFLNDKISNTLHSILRRAQCRTGKEASIFEALSVVTEIVNEAWGKYEIIFKERNQMRDKINVLQEENSILKQKLSPSIKEAEDFSCDYIEAKPWPDIAVAPKYAVWGEKNISIGTDEEEEDDN